MKYPNLDAVTKADKQLLGTWLRQLPSPGMPRSNDLDEETDEDFHERIIEEIDVMNLIYKLFQQQGGWTPRLSKLIGW